MVGLSAAAGFALASRDAGLDWARLAAVSLGVVLAAFGANAFNQWLEAERDARMHRTRRRPLPAGELALAESLVFATICTLVGPLLLIRYVNIAAGLLALLNIGIYVLLYTPLKTRTAWNTAVGALVGAIPPLIGALGVRGTLETPAWLLAAILFAWQIPHFLALAWLYREDYERGGFVMLPQIDPSGAATSRASIAYSILLLPLAAGIAVLGASGVFFAITAGAASIWMTWLALRFQCAVTDQNARRLFLASIIYLPLVLTALVLDRRATQTPDTAPVMAASVESHP